MSIPGFYEARDNDLLCLIIHEGQPDGSFVVETLYTPTLHELELVCSNYNLPADYTIDLITKRNRGAHTVLLELDAYREHLKKEGYRL